MEAGGPWGGARLRGKRELHLLACLVRERKTARNVWTAQRFSMKGGGNVSKQVYRLERALKEERQLEQLWQPPSANREE